MKRCKVLFYALIVFVVIPLLINASYQTDNPVIYTVWDASDVLDYYGTIVSATIPVLILAFTIRIERKRLIDERNYMNMRDTYERNYVNMKESIRKAYDIMQNTIREIRPDRVHDVYFYSYLSCSIDEAGLGKLLLQDSNFMTKIDSMISDCRKSILAVSEYNLSTVDLEKVCEKIEHLNLGYTIRAGMIHVEIMQAVQSNQTKSDIDFNRISKELEDISNQKEHHRQIDTELTIAIQKLYKQAAAKQYMSDFSPTR